MVGDFELRWNRVASAAGDLAVKAVLDEPDDITEDRQLDVRHRESSPIGQLLPLVGVDLLARAWEGT